MSVRYVEMSEPQYEYISKRVRESFPESCICWIEENLNTKLLTAFENRKSEIAKRGAINEVKFFHGTSENVVTSIAAGGFDPTYNKASAYGKGTYFAKNASYSFSYMKPNAVGISFMFLCDVIIGTPCLGSGNLIIDTMKFDSAVDVIKDPSIVVTPYADAAYPRYIIAFHKNAK